MHIALEHAVKTPQIVPLLFTRDLAKLIVIEEELDIYMQIKTSSFNKWKGIVTAMVTKLEGGNVSGSLVAKLGYKTVIKMMLSPVQIALPRLSNKAKYIN